MNHYDDLWRIVPGAALTALAVGRAGSLIIPLHPWLPVACALAGFLVVAVWPARVRLMPVAVALLAALACLVAARILAPLSVIAPLDPVSQAREFVAPCSVVVGAALSELLRERRSWTAVSLAGLLLLLSADVNVLDSNHFPLYLVLAFVVILVSAMPSWRQIGAGAVTIAATVAIIGAAWHVPAAPTSWSANLSDPLRAALSDRAGPGTTLSLIGPFHPSSQVLMSITTRHRGPLRVSALAYDYFTGTSWESDATTILRLRGGAHIPAATGQDTVRISVRLHQPMSVFAFAGAARSVSLGTEVESLASGVEPLSVRPRHPLPAGTTYTSDAYETDGAPIYGAIETDYLQIGSEPLTVQRLAQRLQRSTPLATAFAIRDYLRGSRYHYDSTAGSPPSGNAVATFLFDTRRGYCNQFSSAMAILLREDGIPSRLITGYLTTEVRPGHYVVRGLDAHSWVQAYLPESGWTTFDPTPGIGITQPVRTFRRADQPRHQTSPAQLTSIMRRGREPVQTPQSLGRPTGHRVASRSASHPHGPSIPLPALAIPIVILILVVAAVALARRRRSVDDLYRSISAGRTRSRDRIQSHETPLEFAARLKGSYAGDLREIINVYVATRYGRHTATSEEIERSRAAWQRATTWSQRLLS
ncbi:MAG TPA: transglutaminase domain-containing protein [Chloroflexota bacterium]|nr:transglutaminase domain-containing protein [Chloroflexota bacterium]